MVFSLTENVIIDQNTNNFVVNVTAFYFKMPKFT